MIINHNISALNTSRQLGIVNRSLSKATECLSSGYRINRAADDAAGLSISEKMRKQIRGLQQGIANAEDGISLCQVADGALNEVTDMIQRISELAVKSANGTNSTSDREDIQMEVSALVKEIDRVSETTRFNELYIFRGDQHENISTGKPTAYGRFFQLLGSHVSHTGYMNEPLTPDKVTDSTSGVEADTSGIPYVSVHADFGPMASQLASFSGTSFYVNCCTDDCPTVIKFTDASSITADANCTNIEIGLKKADGSYYQDAEEFCKYIVEHVFDTVALVPHVQFAYKDTTLFLYDIDNNAWTPADKELAYFCDAEPGSYTQVLGTDNQIYIQSGADAGDGIHLTISSMSAASLGLHSLDVLTEINATLAIDVTKEALKQVSANRSRIGAQQNRLEHTIKNEDNIVENTTAAESQIRDTDIAKESVKHAIKSILLQTGQSMLAQANQSKQGVLSLLG